LRALGDKEPPKLVCVGGEDFEQVSVYKHDSWAATALYSSGERRIVCKFNRVQPILTLPMRWVGRRLARREAEFLERLSDVPLVPDGLGPVSVDGRVAENAVAHTFVDGAPFRDRNGIAPDFIRQLERLVKDVHRRGIAYVDLHKRENVIVDTDGRPNLVDFQVSLAIGDRFPWNSRLFRRFVAMMQETDLYHIRKHHLCLFPEEFSAEERRTYASPPGIIGAHRRIAVPLRQLRRLLLTRLGVRDKSGMAESEHEPEVAFRKEGPSIDPKES
jgi:hypothetical protein